MSNSPASRTPSASSLSAILSPTPRKRTAGSDTSLSDAPSEPDGHEASCMEFPNRTIYSFLPELYEENIFAKIYRTASRSLGEARVFTNPDGAPLAYPESVPQDGRNAGSYEFRDPEFWTCGFFPGSLYALLERSIRHPSLIPIGTHIPGPGGIQHLRANLQSLCSSWSQSLHDMAFRTDTHDIGFIVMPALKRDWELSGNEESLRSIIRAALSLATRYVPTAGAIRSWDCLVKKEITVTDKSENLLVIIDSLCNLDLLFYASAHTGNETLSSIAATHARTLLMTHLRPENGIVVPENGYQGQLYSTCHVANIDPVTGGLKWRWTAQGYSNESTWSRGQAWAILGYAQTYVWTKETVFLEASCGAAEYFLHRLQTAPMCVETELDQQSWSTKRDGNVKLKKGRHVPLWDFDAPVSEKHPLRDSSAGVIAANGLLVLSQALTGVGQDRLARRFRDAALDIVRDTLDLCLSREKAQFFWDGAAIAVQDCESGFTFDSILKNGTANNNQNARRRYCNHGLVYGDYYLIEFGNRLLAMGFV